MACQLGAGRTRPELGVQRRETGSIPFSPEGPVGEAARKPRLYLLLAVLCDLERGPWPLSGLRVFFLFFFFLTIFYWSIVDLQCCGVRVFCGEVESEGLSTGLAKSNHAMPITYPYEQLGLSDKFKSWLGHL